MKNEVSNPYYPSVNVGFVEKCLRYDIYDLCLGGLPYRTLLLSAAYAKELSGTGPYPLREGMYKKSALNMFLDEPAMMNAEALAYLCCWHYEKARDFLGRDEEGRPVRDFFNDGGKSGNSRYVINVGKALEHVLELTDVRLSDEVVFRTMNLRMREIVASAGSSSVQYPDGGNEVVVRDFTTKGIEHLLLYSGRYGCTGRPGLLSSFALHIELSKSFLAFSGKRGTPGYEEALLPLDSFHKLEIPERCVLTGFYDETVLKFVYDYLWLDMSGCFAYDLFTDDVGDMLSHIMLRMGFNGDSAHDLSVLDSYKGIDVFAFSPQSKRKK